MSGTTKPAVLLLVADAEEAERRSPTRRSCNDRAARSEPSAGHVEDEEGEGRGQRAMPPSWSRVEAPHDRLIDATRLVALAASCSLSR